MAFVKFVKDDGLNAAQRRIPDQLPEQDALGFELDACGIAHAVFETDLVTDLAPQFHAKLVRHA